MIDALIETMLSLQDSLAEADAEYISDFFHYALYSSSENKEASVELTLVLGQRLPQLVVAFAAIDSIVWDRLFVQLLSFLSRLKPRTPLERHRLLAAWLTMHARLREQQGVDHETKILDPLKEQLLRRLCWR